MRPYKLRIVYDVDGWAYHHNALGLQRYAPEDFEISLVRKRGIADPGQLLGDDPPDAVFLLERTRVSEISRRIRERNWPTAVIAAWSNGWPFRTDTFHHVYRSSDALLICNATYWENTGRQPDTYAIPYGYDPRIFGLHVAPEERTHKVIWCGSEFHRGLKGYDEIMLPLRAHLEERGIAHDFRLVDSFEGAKASLEDMADWYNDATVLVCASETEGTPNVALEAAACGCTVVSTPVGNMTELIRPGENGYLVERNVQAILAGVEQAILDYRLLSHRMQADVAAYSWPRLAPRFYEMFRYEIERKRKGISRTGRWPDLSSSVTCVVLRREGDTLSNCMATIYCQQHLVAVEALDLASDQQSLWRSILNRCRTHYILLLDESMRLAPGALTKLWERWCNRGAGRYLLQDPSILESPPSIQATLNAPLMIDRDVARAVAERMPSGNGIAQPTLYARCIAVGVPEQPRPALPLAKRSGADEARYGRRAAE